MTRPSGLLSTLRHGREIRTTNHPKRPRDRELANFKPEYQFVVRQYRIGKGHSVSVLWRGGEVDTVFGFEKEDDALQWIKEKSQGWLLENRKARVYPKPGSPQT
jgi:hypothetical protein